MNGFRSEEVGVGHTEKSAQKVGKKNGTKAQNGAENNKKRSQKGTNTAQQSTIRQKKRAQKRHNRARKRHHERAQERAQKDDERNRRLLSLAVGWRVRPAYIPAFYYVHHEKASFVVFQHLQNCPHVFGGKLLGIGVWSFLQSQRRRFWRQMTWNWCVVIFVVVKEVKKQR